MGRSPGKGTAWTKVEEKVRENAGLSGVLPPSSCLGASSGAPSQHPSDSPRHSSEAVAAGAGCLCEQWIRWVEQLCRKTILIGRTKLLCHLTNKGLQKHQIATASLTRNACMTSRWSQFPVMVSNETKVEATEIPNESTFLGSETLQPGGA